MYVTLNFQVECKVVNVTDSCQFFLAGATKLSDNNEYF